MSIVDSIVQNSIVDSISKKFNHWRLRIFYAMYIGYALYYLTRKGLAFAMPSLMADLGYDKAQLGLLGTTLAMSYGFSKFISGIIGDRVNPRYFMSLGLIASGIVNIFFGFSSSLPIFIGLWALNGYFQGFGWPSCTRLLTSWYSKSERGRWWSLFATSQNVGGALIPLVAAYFAEQYGWRAAMIFPGILVILGGFFLMNRLTDSPKSEGLPSIEEYRNDYGAVQASKDEDTLSMKEVLFTYVFKNPYLWVLGISYFFIYLIRQAMSDWTVLYLVEQKGYTQIFAGATLFWFEVGGILGGILAGWVSDTVFKGNRGPVIVLYCAASLIAIYALQCSSGPHPVIDTTLIFSIGFLLFGPLILIGIAAAELTHKRAVATANGFIGWIAYLGAACAGYPLGKITQLFGWNGFFITLLCCSAITTLLLIPLWNATKKVPQLSHN
jgi:MFS transporter, OPA family, sugar phosphate sensor protein UhpC